MILTVPGNPEMKIIHVSLSIDALHSTVRIFIRSFQEVVTLPNFL